MQKYVLAVVFSLLAGHAFATEKSHGRDHGSKGSKPTTATSSSQSGAIAAAGAVAGSLSLSSATGGVGNGGAGGTGGTGGNAAGGTANASIGAMNFSFTQAPGSTSPAYSFVKSEYTGPNNTPAMGNSYISTSNICDSGTGLGLALPGFGGQLSISQLRMMCEGRLNAQAHNALGQTEKARLTMEVVQEFACEENATWAKIARKKGLCAPAEESAAVTKPNPAFNSD